MALSPKDREKIIEEETLRYETRAGLAKQACGGHGRHRPGRWFFGLACFLLGIAVHALICHHGCGYGYGARGCSMDGGMMPGRHCMMGQGGPMGGPMEGGMMAPAEAAPAAPAPAAKAKK